MTYLEDKELNLRSKIANLKKRIVNIDLRISQSELGIKPLTADKVDELRGSKDILQARIEKLTNDVIVIKHQQHNEEMLDERRKKQAEVLWWMYKHGQLIKQRVRHESENGTIDQVMLLSHVSKYRVFH